MPAPKGNDYAKGNKGGGRKSGYRKPFAKQVFKYALLGLTEEKMAELFDVSFSTFKVWKRDFKEFSNHLRNGKEKADADVAVSLYDAAKGYTSTETVIEEVEPAVKDEHGNIITPAKTKKKTFTKKVAGDPRAARYWLGNRHKKVWKERQEIGFDPESNTEFEIYIGKKKLNPATKKPA